MPKLAYVQKNFHPATRHTIIQANQILEEYEAQGFSLTLRQLYYQFVARDIIPNKQAEYNKLGNVINDARLAGVIDWNHIIDRTRNIASIPHWDDPADVIDAAARGYHTDLWATQEQRVEVWIEKDALVGVIEPICRKLDVPYLSCRGYTSQSEMWQAGQRFLGYILEGQSVKILHFGDHDPSGIDMTRDITERLENFIVQDLYRASGRASFDASVEQLRDNFTLERVALNMDQVLQYDPPPNPAKITDSRYEKYRDLHGDESWELDALEPSVMSTLIQNKVEEDMDIDLWNEAVERMNEEKDLLKSASKQWNNLVDHLQELTDDTED